MNVEKFVYNEMEVEFYPAGKNNVMVNATQMAKVFNQQVERFTRLKETKSFIEECLKSYNCSFLGIKTEEDLISSVQKSGTFMHRILALKFAAWLNPAFELWVYFTIDQLLNKHFADQRDAIIEKLTAKRLKEDKKHELLLKYPEMSDYFELERQEQEAINKRITSTKQQEIQIRINFFTEE